MQRTQPLRQSTHCNTLQHNQHKTYTYNIKHWLAYSKTMRKNEVTHMLDH